MYQLYKYIWEWFVNEDVEIYVFELNLHKGFSANIPVNSDTDFSVSFNSEKKTC